MTFCYLASCTNLLPYLLPSAASNATSPTGRRTLAFKSSRAISHRCQRSGRTYIQHAQSMTSHLAVGWAFPAPSSPTASLLLIITTDSRHRRTTAVTTFTALSSQRFAQAYHRQRSSAALLSKGPCKNQ